MLSTIKSAIKWLWAEPTSYSKKPKKKIDVFGKDSPLKIRLGNYWVIFWEESQEPIDPHSALCYILKDKDDLFKICEGKVYMSGAYDSVITSLIDNPIIQELVNRTKYMNN